MVNLPDFSIEKNNLVSLVTRKIAELKVTDTNERFDKKLKIDIASVTNILDAIESKIKKTEIIYHTYFANIDHGILSGNSATLPKHVNNVFMDGTAQLEYSFKVDDKAVYKELIDLNFQNFILLMASIYENLVILSEMLIKKVVVGMPQPISIPLHNYTMHLENLITLGYRKNDKLNTCIISSAGFFNKYLPHINSLRNKFIHGYSINLASDGAYYFVSKLSFTHFTTPGDLIVDAYVFTILENSKTFISALLVALKESIKHHSKTVPA